MAMFKDEPEKNVQETIIGADVVLTGNLKSSGNVQINGRVKGKITTDADILIGETAQIDGSIKCRTAVINGQIQGNIETAEDLEIAPTGKIFGDVITQNLIIKKGSIFIGKSTMPEAEGEIPKEGEKIKAAEEESEETKKSIEPIIEEATKDLEIETKQNPEEEEPKE